MGFLPAGKIWGLFLRIRLFSLLNNFPSHLETFKLSLAERCSGLACTVIAVTDKWEFPSLRGTCGRRSFNSHFLSNIFQLQQMNLASSVEDEVKLG